MKKGSIFLAFTFISSVSIAQVQRTGTPSRQNDTAATTQGINNASDMNKKKMIRELDLTKEQKIKLKEARESSKAKQEAISNDDKLTQEQKDAKLRELKRAQAQNMQGILNEEQRAKMKALRQEMIKKRQKNPGQQNN